ncbi:MAG TPA: EamA family transporter [Ktedonobacterales bacterium]|nr:EamA family transporter [Ktedonobacterales bacterium]
MPLPGSALSSRTRHAPTERTAGTLGDSIKAVPPPILVLLSMTSTQIGAALAKSLFQSIGPTGAVFLRVAFAALVLLAIWRPSLRGYSWRDFRWALLFGGVLAAMNLSFYSSLDRLPLGVAVTVEFIGPLGVALAGSRRVIDLFWVALAGAGIVLLAPTGLFGGASLDPLGVALALLAGVFWGAYILLSARVGRAFPGATGLALAMAVAALLLVPVGVLGAGSQLLDGRFLLLGAGVALLSSVLPYSPELEALRRLPAHVFGVLMSLEPGIAALVGIVLLHEQLELRAVAALVLVMAASVGAARFSKNNSHKG